MMFLNAVRRMIPNQDDMELVVGDCRGPMKILQETGKTKTDVVILTRESEESEMDEPSICSQLLGEYPDLIIMSVAPDQKMVFTLQLSSHRREFSKKQQGAIVQRLREAIGIGHRSPVD